MFQSCLHGEQNDFPLVVREMHLSFENLAVISTPSLQASFMDIHHNTSFRFILEDDFISSASKARICSCSGKGVGLWLVARSFIRSFHITHSTFTLALHFHLALIQPSASSLFMCKHGHMLDASGTHLVRLVDSHTWCHPDVMYALA